jgi:hypothetical protein
MKRALVLALCGVAVSACSNIPGLGGDPAKVSIESNPPGANASLSSGGSCRTPCSLPAPDKSGEYQVTYGLTGYSPHTVTFKVTASKENWYSSEKITVEPNPVTTTLQPAGRPAPQRR